MFFRFPFDSCWSSDFHVFLRVDAGHGRGCHLLFQSLLNLYYTLPPKLASAIYMSNYNPDGRPPCLAFDKKLRIDEQPKRYVYRVQYFFC